MSMPSSMDKSHHWSLPHNLIPRLCDCRQESSTWTWPKRSKYWRNSTSLTMGGMRATKMRVVRGAGPPPLGRAYFACTTQPYSQ